MRREGSSFALDAVTWLADGSRIFRGEGASWTAIEGLDRSARISGVAPDDLWIGTSAGGGLHRFDGVRWRWEQGPNRAVDHLHVAARDRIWVDDGDLRLFDGRRWSRFDEVRERINTITSSGGEGPVWLGTEGGVFRSAAWPGSPPVVELPEARPLDDGAVPPSPLLPLGPADDTHRVERLALPVPPGEPLSATFGISAEAGVIWIAGDDRIVEVDASGRGGREIARAPRTRGLPGCRRCAFPEARGRGRVLLDHTLERLDGARRTPVDLGLEDVVAVAGAGGRFLAVAARAHDDLRPFALSEGPEGARWITGLPPAVWSDVALTADGTAFLAGGTSASEARGRPLPAGEGRLAHLRAGTVTWARAPGSLIAVAAVGPEEAWAVGAGGTVIHLLGGRVERFSLPSGAWLRAVWAAPGELWIGGDGGTLLRHDGRAFHPVSTAVLGPDASITGIGGSGGVIWAASPSGLLRLTRR
jgi:hypothetical protein